MNCDLKKRSNKFSGYVFSGDFLQGKYATHPNEAGWLKNYIRYTLKCHCVCIVKENKSHTLRGVLVYTY